MNKDQIKRIILEQSGEEAESTKGLFRLTQSIQNQKFFQRDQALRVLRWKSPRPTRYYQLNSKLDFEVITRVALKQDDDRLKIHILAALQGVRYPSASALLMIFDQNKYPVIDIRVWQQLYKFGLVKENPRGRGFTLNQWGKYLEIIRSFASDLKLSARQVEKRLFDFSRITQDGNLYT